MWIAIKKYNLTKFLPNGIISHSSLLSAIVFSAQTQRYATIVPSYLSVEKQNAWDDKNTDSARLSPLITTQAAWNNNQGILMSGWQFQLLVLHPY